MTKSFVSEERNSHRLLLHWSRNVHIEVFTTYNENFSSKAGFVLPWATLVLQKVLMEKSGVSESYKQNSNKFNSTLLHIGQTLKLRKKKLH